MRIPFRHALLASLLVPSLAWAWAPEGHRIVGDLAQRELTPQAAAAVADLLKGEPDPTLAGVSSWPDNLRQSDPPRYQRTHAWHYDDLPRGDCHYVAPRDCPDGNCATAAIVAQGRILADPAQPRQARIDALKFVVHFVGDIHQPFHAGFADDKGGNDFQVSLRTAIQPQDYQRAQYVDGVQGTNLHAVWDYYIIANHDTDEPHYVKDLLARATSLDAGAPADETANGGDSATWAEESCRILGAESIYPKEHKLDPAYLETMRPVVERRLLQAGHRLATVLNAALGSGPHE
ncbi:MAG TPA: S1/P1 nuclease [Xanthomonadaceae bacterium]|jgi:hypothetical protein